jgi:hypothetical protein
MISKRILLVLTALFLLAGPSLLPVGAATTTGTATAISLTVVPAKLPADGLAYPAVVVSLVSASAQPTVQLVNTTVFLSVSQNNVGSLPASVVIPAGRTFVIANFTTTTTPGVTTVTASSPGLQSASQTVTTLTTSGYPTHILVFASPSTQLARPAGQPSDTGTVTLELTDDQGLPAKAPTNVTVQLFSSDAKVVNVTQNTLVIRANTSLVTGTFQTGFTPGSDIAITASSSGYVSGSTDISVIGPAPLKLTSAAEPSSIVLGSTGLLLVSLTDQSGNPARAPAAVNVTIRSSNTTVATVPGTVTIPAGSIYTWVSYQATRVSGSATLTVTSPGLQSSSATVQTHSPSAPVSLNLLTSPNPVLSDNTQYNNAVIVQLMGKDSQAAVSNSTSYVVSLTSSTSQIGTVPSTVTIPEGSSYAVAYFQSTYASGSTTITASASNLLPAQAQMNTYGPVPSQIILSVYGSGQGSASGTDLPADGLSHPALAVTLADSSGNPAVAAGNIVIQLSSSRADIVSVDTTVLIPAGTISTIVPIQTSLLPGAANVTASSVGLTSGTLTVNTEIPAPSKIAAYLAPAVALEPDTGNTPMLYIQLQDSQGNPATARQPTSVIVTSSNGALFNGTLSLVIPAGADYARTPVDTTGIGTGTLTASSTGLESSTATLQILPFPFSANITLQLPYSGYMYMNQTATASLHLSLLGQPLKNVSVTWNYNGVAAIPSNGTTDAAGVVTTKLQPVAPGPANITASATGSMFGKLQVTSYLSILSVPAKPKASFAHVLLSYIYYIIIIVAVVIVAAIYLLRMQRKKAKAELEAGFEAVS